MSQTTPLAKPAAPRTVIEVGQPRGFLAAEVIEKSGTDLNRCYQCHACANGCPFIRAMDYPPNLVLRLLQFGMREEVLRCKTIWICVGCHTCSSQCPMGIDMAAVMDTLRLMAVEEGVAIAKPNILDFHEEVLRSLERYGRAHKLGIMWRYKVKTRRWLSDLDVGLKMLAKRKLDLRPSRVQAQEEIGDLFKCYWRESK
ncbi:MAG: 4Fe-4S dicluster domain-containing protein [Desulfobaccales bacterium]|nr:4Fe-4S dicluster domain-containing protein [Desulfobaccales bacterium]